MSIQKHKPGFLRYYRSALICSTPDESNLLRGGECPLWALLLEARLAVVEGLGGWAGWRVCHACPLAP